MLTTKENERLTQVGRGTPMGEFLRRFWLPALLSDELPQNDGDPIRTRTLGEDLVAFRDSNGTVGMVDAYCPHRRAPLFFGRNEECGLRCVYHGWKFDTTGQCIDMPSEPAESDFKDRLRVRAYPTYEVGGMIWVYMGPEELRPSRPPEMPFTLVPESERRGLKFLVEANWLQCLEGELDTAHVSFLHSTFGEDGTGIQNLVRNDGYTNDRHPRLFALDTDYGFVYGGRRAQRKGDYYWRVTQFLMPMTALIPSASGYAGGATMWMPIDDNHCWRYLVGGTRPVQEWNTPGDVSSRRPILPTEPGTFRFPDGKEIDTRLAKFRHSNMYGLDRERQRKLSFTGMPFIPTQDQAMTEGMGYVCDRSEEHLGSSDVAIIHMRRMMLRMLDNFEKGTEPFAPAHPEIYRVRPLDVESEHAELPDVLKQYSEDARMPALV
ncbi:MAG: Rieske 2Fe-2S domain-containing protein [Chloroflexi bacterium]|nr:Rieske 2Fe-2S domain-containing protein [Chloroflexota bacterium]